MIKRKEGFWVNGENKDTEQIQKNIDKGLELENLMGEKGVGAIIGRDYIEKNPNILTVQQKPDVFVGENIIEEEKKREEVYKIIDKKIDPEIKKINLQIEKKEKELEKLEKRRKELIEDLELFKKIADITNSIFNEIERLFGKEKDQQKKEDIVREFLIQLEKQDRKKNEKEDEIYNLNNEILNQKNNLELLASKLDN